MTSLRALRAAAVGLSLLMVLAACGQKPGVHVAEGERATGGGTLAQSGGGATGTPATSGGSADGATPGAALDGTGAAAGSDADPASGGGSGPAAGDGGGTADDPGGGSAGSADAGSAGGTPGSGGTGQSTAGSAGSSGGQARTQGSDRTGAGDETLTLGIHAPVTGAAPLPATSFKQAKDLYWRWQIEEKGRAILGRNQVEVIFRDDRYNPSSARQVCREMAAEAFLLVGGGGTDQIQACGQFAEAAQVPYFSAGVTEAGLTDNPWYFASSMTYRQQGLLLAEFIASNFPDAKVGYIVTDTANFDDAVTGFEQGMEQVGNPIAKAYRHPKGDTSWYTTQAQEFQDAGVDVIYPLTAPTDYIRFAKQASDQGYNPTYSGVGVSMGLNAVLSGGCPDEPGTGIDNGFFFSPFPGLDWARNNVPAFFEAAERFGTPSDDLALALWGIAMQQDVMFQRYRQTFGNDLTREDFRRFTETQRGIETNLFPAVTYSPDDHLGGQSVHVLEANCAKGEYETVGTFRTGF